MVVVAVAVITVDSWQIIIRICEIRERVCFLQITAELKLMFKTKH